MMENHILIEAERLLEIWESIASGARQKALEQEVANYTAGYGIGLADGLESAANMLKSVINPFKRENDTHEKA